MPAFAPKDAPTAGGLDNVEVKLGGVWIGVGRGCCRIDILVPGKCRSPIEKLATVGHGALRVLRLISAIEQGFANDIGAIAEKLRAERVGFDVTARTAIRIAR